LRKDIQFELRVIASLNFQVRFFKKRSRFTEIIIRVFTADVAEQAVFGGPGGEEQPITKHATCAEPVVQRPRGKRYYIACLSQSVSTAFRTFTSALSVIEHDSQLRLVN